MFFKFSTLGYMDVPEQCSKCDQPLDTDGYPRWCKACRATYKRDYERLKKEMAETRGYAAGVAAFREHCAKKFAYFGNAQFTGSQASGWVRTEPFPLPD